jgi:probable phosphoglycerate mutase
MKLFFVRHGATTAPPSVFAGHTDNPLSDKGLRQAKAVAKRLAKQKISCVYCSDKVRAWDTAKAIAKPHGLIALESAKLREIHHGIWEGHTKEEVVSLWPTEYVLWEEDPYLFAPPGGETCLQATARVLPLLREIVIEGFGNEGDIALVSHKAILRLAVAHFLGIPYRLYRDRFELDQASLSILEFKTPSDAKLLLYNDTSHLKP